MTTFLRRTLAPAILLLLTLTILTGVIYPLAIRNAGNGLDGVPLHELGVADPYATLTVHPGCLVSTYLHQAVNQLRELARGDQRHGSCGHGIGEMREGRHMLQRRGDLGCAAKAVPHHAGDPFRIRCASADHAGDFF